MSKASVINKAAFEGNFDELNDLLSREMINGDENFNSIVDKEDSLRGPLHFAVLGRKRDMVSLLLDRYNFSPVLLDEDGWSPLHIAASVGSADIIELLIEGVANRSNSQSSEDSVVIYCNQATKGNAKQYPLHLAAAKGHEQAVIRLLCHGAKASVRNGFGQTPLHRAACAGMAMIVVALLEADPSDVNWKDFSEDSNTALHLAAEDGHFDVVRLLREIGGADLSILNAQNKTPAQIARTQEIRDYLLC